MQGDIKESSKNTKTTVADLEKRLDKIIAKKKQEDEATARSLRLVTDALEDAQIELKKNRTETEDLREEVEVSRCLIRQSNKRFAILVDRVNIISSALRKCALAIIITSLVLCVALIVIRVELGGV